MATKVYDSPTMNLFALLADEHAASRDSDGSRRTNKATPNKGPQQELTPKERAEAKAVENAEKKAKREAEKAKQEEAALRKKAVEMLDDTGFSQQRHQRIKETRQEQRNPEPPTTKSNKGKDNWEGKNKGESKAKSTPNAAWNKFPKSTDSKDSDAKTVTDKNFNKDKTTVKGDGKGNFKSGDAQKKQGNFKGDGKPKDGNFTKGPRSYDKHSQGVTGRQFHAKKQGAGKANWDEPVPAGLSGAPVQEAVNSESLAAPAGDVDGWGDNTPASPAPEGSASPAPETADKKKDTDDESEEEKKKRSYDDFLKDKAEKQAALEALLKKPGVAQPRQLSEEEKKAASKFTQVENVKAGPVKKPEAAKAAPSKPAPTATTAAPVAGARKGEKSVSLDNYFDLRVAGARTGRKGPRPDGGAPRDNAGRGGQRKGGRGPQKISKSQTQFPNLSK